LTDDNGNILDDVTPDRARRVHLLGVAGTGMGACPACSQEPSGMR
jgi:UDP-N-acetylmuramate: L-alanyl-gamma-D-glutamyl-meso-diaminopimelate ligase